MEDEDARLQTALEYAGVSQWLLETLSRCSRMGSNTGSAIWEIELTEDDRAIGARLYLTTVRLGLDDPEVWLCRCCVTRGCTKEASLLFFLFLCRMRV